MSWWGLKSGSKMITVSAVARLILVANKISSRERVGRDVPNSSGTSRENHDEDVAVWIVVTIDVSLAEGGLRVAILYSHMR